MSRMSGTRRGTLLVLAAVLAAVLGLLMSQLVAAGPAQAAPVTITNGTQFTDTAGNVVHAHGAGVIKVGNYYYLLGENRNPDNTFRNVSMYRSTDLRGWEFRNHILTQNSHPELQRSNIERPKVIYNARTGQYVMWMHWENGVDYGQARAAVAVSNTVDGNYSYLGSFRPLGHMSRDITAFVDDDGTGYMISAARENYDLHIYRLTADYTGIAALVANPWPGGHREAPALFKRNGVYFMLTSGATGWQPNQQRYATATSITGPWSAMRDVGNSTAYGSQTTFVLPIQGSQTTSYLYLGDRWGPGQGATVNDSQYVWLPLRFPGNQSLAMDWYPQITIDAATGVVTGVGGDRVNLIARHSNKCADVVNASTADGAEVVQYDCNGGFNQQFQVVAAGGGYVRLMAWHSGRCLGARDGSTANSARIVQQPCDGGNLAQQFQLQDVGGGYSRLLIRHSGSCVDVISGSTANGTRLIQYDCHSGSNQQWRVTAV